MKKMMIVAALAACATGCQTRITAEKNPETVVPIEDVVTVNGEQRVIVRDVVRASGGWYATARSPLWAKEELRGLSIGVATNGTVTLGLDAYDRDLSTNAVVMAHQLVEDFGILAEKAIAAYASCGVSIIGSKAAASAGKTDARAAAEVKRAIASYILKGGSAQNASVTCKDGSCMFTDGVVTEVVSY